MEQVMNGAVTLVQASEFIRVSYRQAKRLK
jgi:hypothetical protein